MIYPIVFILGGAFGWWRAVARGGNMADKLQYTMVFGILATLITLFLTIIASKLGLF